MPGSRSDAAELGEGAPAAESARGRGLAPEQFRRFGKQGKETRGAFLRLLLYTGLRVSDAVKLERSALDRNTGKLLLRIMKTGAPLYMQLKPQVITALDRVPAEDPQYFFWNGRNLKAACYSMWRTIYCRASAHRFRDTFAKHILSNGADLRTLQHRLGHKSIKTTEEHYAHFYAGHQKLLDAAVASLDYGESKPPTPKVVGRRTKRNVVAFPATA